MNADAVSRLGYGACSSVSTVVNFIAQLVPVGILGEIGPIPWLVDSEKTRFKLRRIDMGFDLKAPWVRQLEFFRQKLNLPTEAWDDILKEAYDRAFIVAGAMKAELLDDLRQAVDKSIAEGKSIGWFRKEFSAIVAEHGWDYNGPKNWRSRIIYQTNLQTSYQAGRYQQLTDPDLLKDRPYWVYHHGHPITPRETHLSWNGIALPASDPWWQTHFTPNGFGCTCWISASNKEEIKKKGWKLLDQAPDDGTYQYVVKSTGELVTLPYGVDYGWDYAPGASVAEQLRPKVDALLATLPRPLATALKEDMADKMFPAGAGAYVRRIMANPQDKQKPFDLGITSRDAIAGVAVAGKTIALDHDYSRHALLHHGTEKERLRGQEPITAEDLGMAMDLLEADHAVLSEGDPPVSKNGAKRIEVKVELGGWKYTAVFEVRRHRMVLYTLFKRV